jgi:hypothetical protein
MAEDGERFGGGHADFNAGGLGFWRAGGDGLAEAGRFLENDGLSL